MPILVGVRVIDEKAGLLACADSAFLNLIRDSSSAARTYSGGTAPDWNRLPYYPREDEAPFVVFRLFLIHFHYTEVSGIVERWLVACFTVIDHILRVILHIARVIHRICAFNHHIFYVLHHTQEFIDKLTQFTPFLTAYVCGASLDFTRIDLAEEAAR